MERRTSAVPMDFEWQTGKGPVDERSPFHTFAVAQEQQGKKRPFSIFGSPSKSQPPSLREPTSQMHFLFSDPNANSKIYSSTSTSTVADPLKQPSPTRPHLTSSSSSSDPNTNKSLPSLTASSYFRLNGNSSNAASSFATPRKLEPDICSSGPEGASSPEGNGTVGGADSPLVAVKEKQRANTMGSGGFFGGRALRFGTGAEKDGNDDSGDTAAGDDRHNYDGGFEFEAKKGYMESPPRRSSFFGRLGFLSGGLGSPGRGDLPRGYSTKVEKKVSKRRAATRGPGIGVGPIVTAGSDRNIEKRMVRRKATAAIAAAAANANIAEESSGEEADESSMFLSSPQKGGRSGRNKQSSSSSRQARSDQKYSNKTSSSRSHKSRNYSIDSSSPTKKESILASIFTFIETHPNVPHILSFYLQLLFNLFLVFCFMSILWSFWSTIRADVDKKADEAVAEALAEMAVCAQNYRENRCEPETRVPAMESVCRGWETCMDRDPRMGIRSGKGGVGAGGRAVISARTFAEIFNGFVEPISYKAMFFTVILLSTSIIVSNATFSFFRNKALDSLATYSHNHYGGGHHHRQYQQQQQQQQQAPQELLGLNAGHAPFQIMQHGSDGSAGGGYGRGYGYDDGRDAYSYAYGRPQTSASMKTPRR